jgi:5-methylcytosine-specific restriction endonuclease McrA
MVYVLDKKKEPLMPCSEKRAWLLLERGRASVHKKYPITIRLVDSKQEDSVLQQLNLKIDPGSKQTGIALVRETESTAKVVSHIELKHRGRQISETLPQRAAFRRRPRSANLRYRAPRFDNRRRKEGWLPPSLQHRVDTTISTVSKLWALTAATAISQELVRFDTQLMETAEISGVDYQQGTLAGYEIREREYVFEKWGRKCVYCDKENVPLNLDHVHPSSQGGSDRPSNLVPACIPCNQRKDSLGIRVFLAEDEARLKLILEQAKQPLRDVAAVNATRWALYREIQSLGLPVSVGTGGLTMWNRHRFSIPKTHALDAVCVGNMDSVTEIVGWQQTTLLITATGRGALKRTRLWKYGFPRDYLIRSKAVHGFQTGDMVNAVVPKGKMQGTYPARVAVRASGSFNLQSGLFNLQTASRVVQGISHKHCRMLQRGDGYSYHLVSSVQDLIGKERASAPA